MDNKIGIGYITCDSKSRVERTFPSIPKNIGELVVVNSGCVLSESLFEGADKIIQTSMKQTVAMSKNKALHHLMSAGCDHIFLVEDDMVIKNHNVFEAYIRGAQESGIWHLNYALQGGMNRAQVDRSQITSVKELLSLDYTSKPLPRGQLKYDTAKLAFYPHVIGSFTYLYRGVIKNVGYFDERFPNAFDNIDYTYRVIKKGLHPPYYWFADLADSEVYLESLEDCMTDSVLRSDPDYASNMLYGKAWFKDKYDLSPELIPDTAEDIAIKKVNKLKSDYARKVL